MTDMNAAQIPDAARSRPTWCEVDVAALRHNSQTLRRRLRGNAALGQVIKADAYGHGLAQVAPVLADEADWLIINSAHEALALRAIVGPTPRLYCCGPTLPFEAEAIVEASSDVVVVASAQIEALARAAQAAKKVVGLHIKVETGTHRQGVDVEETLALATLIGGLEGVVLRGLTTHYADIEDTTDHRFADRQTAGLERARAAVVDAGHPRPMIHAANSAAVLLDARTHHDLVRAGISTYGLWPSKETQAAWLEQRLREHKSQPPRPAGDVVQSAGGNDDDEVPTLIPVLRWRALLNQVKSVPAGGYVGYGRTYRATHPSRIAIVPVGYHEGYDRRLSNVGHVLVDGVRCPVRGRVCMNMMMVDVTDVPSATMGSVATLLGSDGDETISAEQLAGWMGTIHYEVTSRIHPSVPRISIQVQSP